MQVAALREYVRVEDYLAFEEAGEDRHEYLGGLVYAMAGETRAHNQIVGNLYLCLRQHTTGGPCKVYQSDIRVRFKIREDEYYYYPDIVVTCDPSDNDNRFVRSPKLMIEVMSPSTGRIDKREKFFAYTTIESLEEYALVEQAGREVIMHRRSNGWRVEKSAGPHASLVLDSLRLAIPVATIYEGL